MPRKLLNAVALSVTLGIVACAPQPSPIAPTSTISITIPPRPREPQTTPLNVQVFTKDNFATLQTQLSKNPKSVFLVLNPPDYEALVNNIGELRRFIEQQTGVIQYYETTIQALQKSNKTQ